MIDQILEVREHFRQLKNWNITDELRTYLDSKNVFVFDTKQGQEVYYLTENYFKRKESNITKRQYVEYRIKEDEKAEKNFEAWLYTTNKKRLKLLNE